MDEVDVCVEYVEAGVWAGARCDWLGEWIEIKRKRNVQRRDSANAYKYTINN